MKRKIELSSTDTLRGSADDWQYECLESSEADNLLDLRVLFIQEISKLTDKKNVNIIIGKNYIKGNFSDDYHFTGECRLIVKHEKLIGYMENSPFFIRGDEFLGLQFFSIKSGEIDITI